MFRLALASLAFSLVGCLAADGAGDEAIYIVKAVAANDDCSFSSTESEPYIGHGTINVFSPNPYLLYPQLKSRITATDATEQQQKTIQIRGARVTLDFKDTAIASLVSADQKKFQSLFSAPLAPGSGSSTDARFEVIPDGALAAIAAGAGANEVETEVVASIEVFGDLAGSEVTSQSFQFPITVCSNCVIGNLAPDGSLPTCPMATSIRAGNACNPFQDGVVDCCTQDGVLVCPGIAAQN